MSYQVYILYSSKLDKFYVGCSKDINQRLLHHNTSQSKYTATGVPWILIWCCVKVTRKEARTLERKLKNLTRVRKVRFMQKYGEGISDFELLRWLQ